MRHPFLIAGAGIILIIAQLLLWSGLVVFQLPYAQEELEAGLKLNMPVKVMPLILDYYPELEALTYESSIGYCEYREAMEMDMEVEGITDEYVCEVIDDGLVHNTYELRYYLARKVVGQKVDEYSLVYGEQVSGVGAFGLPLVLAGIFIGIAAFAVFYFGSTTLPKGLFYYSVASAVWALGFMGISMLLFLFAPGIVMGQMEKNIAEGFESEVFVLTEPYIWAMVEGLFVEPALIFGGMAFVFSFVSALFYLMSMNSKD
ncbi:hypothetical protein GF412_03695 [Candidatus Micrarchaeota archaeon]|nr:hypothetical protein [Candidatus Micrarchaeota archaeon]MBD3418053.1 hypothetical protein [Candidatus Micrarchaeota archaeon]